LYKQTIIYDDHNTLHLLRPILLDGELQGILHLADDQVVCRRYSDRFYLIISLMSLLQDYPFLLFLLNYNKFSCSAIRTDARHADGYS